jgi:DNA-binding CsgD family transcriptional regulator
MGKSQRIRLRDVRAIYLLLGECCELGADPLVWRTHMLQQICQILGGQIAIYGEQRLDGTMDEICRLNFLDLGWSTDRDKELFLFWLDQGDANSDPMCQAMGTLLPATRGTLTCLRSQLVSDPSWYSSSLFNEYYRSMRIDDQLQSYCQIDADRVSGISLIRPLGARPFDERQRRLLELFHRDMCRLLGTKLAKPGGPSIAQLSPRLAQVLLRLLEGDGEKQIALRLGISRHTVHEHVKRLHRHFGVSTRAELLSQCFRFVPPLQKLIVAEKSSDGSAAIRAFGDAFRLRQP